MPFKTHYIDTNWQEGKSGQPVRGRINGLDVSRKIEAVCNEIESMGFEVMSVIPVISGFYEYETRALKNKVTLGPTSHGGGWGYGYGFSFTEGIIILARKR